MVRLLFGATIKRFFSLFLTLIFVCSVSAGLCSAFLSAKDHLYADPIRFFNEYGYVDEYLSLTLDERSEYMGLYDIEGVASIDMRLSLDVHLIKDDGRIINARILTYNDKEEEIMKRYVRQALPRQENQYNIAVSGKFASNNHFTLGQKLTLSLYGYSQEVYVQQIVDTVEGIYPTFNPYVWSDDYDYGYLYFLEDDLNAICKNYASLISFLPEVKAKVLEATNLDAFDASTLSSDFASEVVNEIIIKNKEGYGEEDVLSKVSQYLKEKGIAPLFALKGEDTPSRKYMQSVNKQLGVAFVFLPIFFYAIVMVLVGLFIAQMIQESARNIGIMLSNGATRGAIIRIYLAFVAAVVLIASLLSIPLGYGISSLVTAAMVKTYCVPLIGDSLHVGVVLASLATLLGVSLLSCLLSSAKIFSLTPKDAAIHNEASRKPLAPKIEKSIAKMPFIAQSATNSMLQNKRRFFLSTFTMGASLLMMLLCGSFYLSKSALIDQGCETRMNYDCQVYLQEQASSSLIEELKQEESVSALLDCDYAYLEVFNVKGDSKYLECLAFNPNENNDMIAIPSDNGVSLISLSEEGIILPKGYASELGVKAGESVFILGHEIKVTAISYQFYHPVTYLSKATLEATGATYYSSLLLNTNDETRLSTLLNQKTSRSLIIFTSSLKKDLHRIFDTLDIFLWIMTIFALAIALVVLLIMNHNALIEQIRHFSLLRAVGFNIMTIMKIFLFQNAVELVLAGIFAIPLNVLASHILFALASSARQTYPFIFSFPLIGLSLAFALFVIALSHLLSLHKLKRLEIAEHLRSAE